MEKIYILIKKIILVTIHAYQYCISPLFGPRCRFYPSCSAYAEQAITECGICKGMWLSISRLLRCHPFHPGGHDPVPTEKFEKL